MEPEVAERIFEPFFTTKGAAGTAEEGLALADGHGGPIDVLVADLVLPGMTGLDLATELRRRHPAVHVIYTSGYLDESTSARVAREGALFLAKPFGGKALLAQVASRFDAAAEPDPEAGQR
jgi:DNA-binding response OmpR family regulator